MWPQWNGVLILVSRYCFLLMLKTHIKSFCYLRTNNCNTDEMGNFEFLLRFFWVFTSLSLSYLTGIWHSPVCCISLQRAPNSSWSGVKGMKTANCSVCAPWHWPAVTEATDYSHMTAGCWRIPLAAVRASGAGTAQLSAANPSNQ